MPAQSSSTPEFALRLDGVALGYGDFTVLRDISMDVRAGEVVAIMGGSGSGKTTLLRAATGQLIARQGQVHAFGQDISLANPDELQALRKRMGVLFQQGALFTDLNVFENVAFPLREHTRLSEADVTERALDKLDAVGLRAAAHLKVAEISGGMARRAGLYDEPFAGLDPISLGITARLIRHLADRLGCASVLITHDVQESFSIADHVYLVGQGKLAAAGTPETLSASQDPYVQQFLKGEPDGPVAFQYPETPAFQKWLSQQKGRKA
jgi:phospholipid/cholesterol/gamma-HCH transport system ATP-binding protein